MHAQSLAQLTSPRYYAVRMHAGIYVRPLARLVDVRQIGFHHAFSLGGVPMRGVRAAEGGSR